MGIEAIRRHALCARDRGAGPLAALCSLASLFVAHHSLGLTLYGTQPHPLRHNGAQPRSASLNLYDYVQKLAHLI